MGIFEGRTNLWTAYQATVEFRELLLGGVPRNPKMIEGWLRAKAGMSDDEEVKERMLLALAEMGVQGLKDEDGNIRKGLDYTDAVKASEELASEKSTVGFKRDTVHGLYIEDRQVKAALKEAVNILYASEKWGPTRKSPRNMTAERVYVRPGKLFFGKSEPDTIELIIGHVTGPQGPRSTLTYHEAVYRPVVQFEVLVARDFIDSDSQWPDIWSIIEEGGLGSVRSQSHGRFEVTQWDKLDRATPLSELHNVYGGPPHHRPADITVLEFAAS